MISESAQTMQRLIASMLDFAQFGHGDIRREPVNISEIIRALQVILSDEIAESGAIISCSDLPVIEADRIQIQQVFQNLLTNAIKYRKSNETLRISISAQILDWAWIFAVQDNGTGIPADSLQRIFEPLKRLHGSEVKGTGLGLTLCRRTVGRHGGRIWAESGGPDCGATIRFSIPRH
jgi:signal transduction histidine kinase